MPYLTAVITTYGTTVLDRVRDDAAEASVDAATGVGRRILRRLLGRNESRAEVEAAVTDLANRPGDEAAELTLRAQVMTALRDDPPLRADLMSLLPTPAGVTVTAVGERSVAAQSITGAVTTGDESPIRR
ncbi:MAG: hypothetical protein HYR62_03815 [Actinobacteria bacterium]|nr:hypothetical protein [Actinomycetota bacterium]